MTLKSYAECRYAECLILSVKISVFMLNVVVPFEASDIKIVEK
jgi:hypothetical protein